MTQESVLVNDKEIQNEFQKLTTLFNEEIYTRITVDNIAITKFKIYDELVQYYSSIEKLEEANTVVRDHLELHPESVSARYITGIISLIQQKIEDFSQIKSLLEQLRLSFKWGIVEYVSDQILQYGEQRIALKAKAEALEKLHKNKELKPVLEKLAKNDRKNPEIAKKYGLIILEEDKPKAISYLKQAAESFARSKDYIQLEEIWEPLVLNNFEDLQFFERIERILLANKERARVGYLLPRLMETYKQLEDYDKTIYFLKKILDNDPFATKYRSELIKCYKIKYSNHSLLDEFLKMSEIGNTKKPIKACIHSFERNIVFDTNNYVMHRNWGVGKIKSISSSSDSIMVDFLNKKDHKLSIQMAITSLKPLHKEHLWVKLYENPEEIHRLFNEDVPGFIVELLTSHENLMTLADIKAEIIGRFIKKSEDWSKWWNKSKISLKKDPRIGFNPKKKDEIHYRQKPISLTEVLTEKFNAHSDINKKLEVALETINPDVLQDAYGSVETCLHYYYEEEEAKDSIKKIVAFIFLDMARSRIDKEEEFPRHLKPEDIYKIIGALKKEEVLQISKQLTNIEVKKAYVNLIRKSHKEYTDIFIGMLFEVPVKVNKHVFTTLVNEEKYSELNLFIETAMNKSKENPEVFLWVAKSIFSGTWNFTWLNVSEKDLLLRVFRILKPLGKIEEKGTKLKNLASDLLFGNEAATITRIIKEAEEDYIRKVFALYKEVPYVSDLEKEKFLEMISKIKPEFVWNQALSNSDEVKEDQIITLPSNVILVTQEGFNRKKDIFDHLVNVEMIENSKDIGEAQEKGDLRENAEYKAAMERQTQLQAEVTKMDSELRNVRIIDLSKVNIDKTSIGCKISVKNLDTKDITEFTILGPWDADTEKKIISYQSPMGKALIGRKVGEKASMDFDNSHVNFEILSISRYSAK
jgi:transcription elongation factor GreA